VTFHGKSGPETRDTAASEGCATVLAHARFLHEACVCGKWELGASVEIGEIVCVTTRGVVMPGHSERRRTHSLGFALNLQMPHLSRMPDIGAQFVELLDGLTKAGKAVWCQTSDDVGRVYCFIGEERLDFHLYGASGSDLVAPLAEVHGVSAFCRNQEVLYVQPEFMAPRLLELLRAAPTDDELFGSLQGKAYGAFRHNLQKYADAVA
jgi:hypothetical protein